MMNPVHIRRDNDPPQPTLDPGRELDVTMVEHGACIQSNLKCQNGQRRSAQWDDHKEFDSKRQEDLDGMKAGPRRHVNVKIRVVHPMQPPKHRNEVKDAVLQINGQIKQNQRDQAFSPHRQERGTKKPPCALLGE
jgi:hypothetical protein